MQWFRFYNDFLHNSKVQLLSEKDQRRYVMMLCMKSCNRDETLQKRDLLFHLRVTETELDETIDNLQRENLITKDLEIVNWSERQYVSDSSTERVRKYREKKKKKCNVTVTRK